jgi:magnesium chelatase family protein
MADRIDLHVHVGAVPLQALSAGAGAEGSASVRVRVEAARARQRRRYLRSARVACNAHAPGRWLDAHGGLEPAARELLTAAAERLRLTARGYHRVVRVARTIADLDDMDAIAASHVAEALRYRPAA